MYFSVNIVTICGELDPLDIYYTRIFSETLGSILKHLKYHEHLDYGAGYVIIKIDDCISVAYFKCAEYIESRLI